MCCIYSTLYIHYVVCLCVCLSLFIKKECVVQYMCVCVLVAVEVCRMAMWLHMKAYSVSVTIAASQCTAVYADLSWDIAATGMPI